MNILMLRHSGGFEHSYLPDAEVLIKKLALEHDWQATTTHHPQRLTPEALEKLDLLIFATTGELPFDDAQKQAILDFVKGGKGFMGIHNATDTCYEWAAYGEMIGGYFNGHPWSEKVRVIVEDQDHPATRMLGSAFELTEEVYTFKAWDRSKTRVLMRLDNDSVDVAKGNRDDDDYAMGWCHDYGQGRVMYTALGHYDHIWHEDWMARHILGAMRWAGGLED